MSKRIYLISVQIPYNDLERRRAKGHNVNPVTWLVRWARDVIPKYQTTKKSQFDFNNGTE